jgi:hypothetical protein
VLTLAAAHLVTAAAAPLSWFQPVVRAQSEPESFWLAFVVMLHVGSAVGLLRVQADAVFKDPDAGSARHLLRTVRTGHGHLHNRLMRGN